MKLTREQMIKTIINERLEQIDSYTSFEEACSNFIRNGIKGLVKLTDEELRDEYILLLHPEEDIEVIA